MFTARVLARLGRRSARLSRFVAALFREWYGLPVAPTHYYSPLPDMAGVKSRLARWHRDDRVPGIDWNLPGQLALLDALAAIGDDGALPPLDHAGLRVLGPGFGEVEGAILFRMVRRLKPHRVIEVGSGVSTLVLDAALRANREHDGVGATLTCFEPWPSDVLRAFTKERGITLDAREVQATSLDTFTALSRGDVLFIDSSHASRKDSDVDFLVLDVLPRLAAGVVVHIHDIPFPLPALPTTHPLFDLSILWNEPALVQAFLAFNSAYRVLMCQAMLHLRHPDALRRAIPAYDPTRHFPTSLWIERVG